MKYIGWMMQAHVNYLYYIVQFSLIPLHSNNGRWYTDIFFPVVADLTPTYCLGRTVSWWPWLCWVVSLPCLTWKLGLPALTQRSIASLLTTTLRKLGIYYLFLMQTKLSKHRWVEGVAVWQISSTTVIKISLLQYFKYFSNLLDYCKTLS